MRMPKNLFNLISVLALFLTLSSCQKELTAEVARKILMNDVVETKPPVLLVVNQPVGYVVAGYYSGLPALYDSTTKTYPLLISLHGAAQYGNGGVDLPLILQAGVPKLLSENLFPPNFLVNGKNYSFIVLAPQLTKASSIDEIQHFIDFAKSKYRIDPSRVYITGLSVGSEMTWQMGIQHSTTLSAIVPFSGMAVTDTLPVNASTIANTGLPVWAFQNDDDPIFNPLIVKDFIAAINKNAPAVPARLTEKASGGHDTWTLGTDPAYKENGMNIYEWMLQYHR
jgi:predicted peptidase